MAVSHYATLWCPDFPHHALAWYDKAIYLLQMYDKLILEIGFNNEITTFVGM